MLVRGGPFLVGISIFNLLALSRFSFDLAGQ